MLLLYLYISKKKKMFKRRKVLFQSVSNTALSEHPIQKRNCNDLCVDHTEDGTQSWYMFIRRVKDNPAQVSLNLHLTMVTEFLNDVESSFGKLCGDCFQSKE